MNDSNHGERQQLRKAMVDLERSYGTTIEVLGDTLRFKDAETEGHSRRVTAFTVAFARQVGVAKGSG